MKICTKCKIEKPLTEFSINQSKRDGHSSECKACHKIIRKSYYDRNRKAERLRIESRKQKQMLEYQEIKSKLFCLLCGENHPAALQFHHINQDEKEINVSYAVRSGWSMERIKLEIEKCVVLCANCHFKEHYELKTTGNSLLPDSLIPHQIL